MDELTKEYEAWCEEQGLPLICAEEQLVNEVSEEQYQWLLSFIIRWDRQRAILDRLSNLRALGATV